MHAPTCVVVVRVECTQAKVCTACHNNVPAGSKRSAVLLENGARQSKTKQSIAQHRAAHWHTTNQQFWQRLLCAVPCALSDSSPRPAHQGCYNAIFQSQNDTLRPIQQQSRMQPPCVCLCVGTRVTLLPDIRPVWVCVITHLSKKGGGAVAKNGSCGLCVCHPRSSAHVPPSALARVTVAVRHHQPPHTAPTAQLSSELLQACAS